MMTENISSQNIPPIILIGMMGSGKTTIGRALARELGVDFIDLDHEIVHRCGVDIPTIFDIEGEEGFRKRETDTLGEVVQQQQHTFILSTGGGTPVLPMNQVILKKKGIIVYLHASLEALYERVAKDSNRPLLKAENPKETLRGLVERRHPIYSRLADITIETESGSVHKTVSQLKQMITAQEYV